MTEPTFWQRFRAGRTGQILLVYLGTAWLVLQLTEILADAFVLPAWVLPVAVLLLLVGLVVVMATAWVQARTGTAARRDAGQVPDAWEVAPRDLLTSLLRGRLPHPTWGRAVAGGVLALSLLFLGAALHSVFSVPRPPRGGDGALAPPDGIGVVPFEVRGAEMDLWREGMMDLLANSLDGLGGLRTIDTRTLMARWRQQVGDTPGADLATVLRVAASAGARYAVAGSVVGLGRDVRLVANVYDVRTGAELVQGRAEGPVGDVLRLADELVVRIMPALLESIGGDGSARTPAPALTTASLPALSAYLEGEAAYRRGRFADAVGHYERALTADSAFALAIVRLAEAYGWLESMDGDLYLEYSRRAQSQAAALPPRYRALLEAWAALDANSQAGVPILEDAVRNYPDDPELWFLLAETYLHIGESTYATREEIWEALQRAHALDPDFAPYLIHLAELAVLEGNRAAAEEAVVRYERLTGDSTALAYVELAIPLLLGNPAEIAAALDRARSAPARELRMYLSAFPRFHDRFDLDEQILSIYSGKEDLDRRVDRAWIAAAMGELERGAALVAGPGVTPAQRAHWWGYAVHVWDVPLPDSSVPGGGLRSADCDEPQPDPHCHLFVGAAAARWSRSDLHARALARLREGAAALRTEDPLAADQWAAYADDVEAAWLWRHGEPARARILLERHAGKGHQAFPNWEGDVARTELAWLEAFTGRPTEALRHFRAEELYGWGRPLGLYGLARMSRELGREEDARYWYGRLAALTRSGDDLPRIREAREALAR